MLASIIGVGTELTTGQIIDKNSSWISKQLKDFGLQSSLHLVVPDDRLLILQALRFAASHGDTLFVTGGLGPTSDDFTRDLIAEWAEKPLEFHEPSWQHVCERLSSRNIAIRDSQKQQCFFPAGSEVLHNPEGTANGFFLRAHGKDVYVLPGPPSEIAAIWKLGIHSRIAERAKNVDRKVTYSWDTLGLGESDVSQMTEECLRGIQVEKGYRVHLPYVEVKLSFLESERAMLAHALKDLEKVLAPITVARNGEQASELLVKTWHQVAKVVVVDAVSGKYLLGRLASAHGFGAESPSWTLSSNENIMVTDPQALKLVLKPLGTAEATAEIHYQGSIRRDSFEAPLMIQKNKHRRGMYFAERAMIFWLRHLSAMV